MSRNDRINKLKNKIQNHLDNGGSIYDKKKNIPYYSYLIHCLKKDAEVGIVSTVESLYEECGFDYISRKREITLERIKKEIDSYVENGGDIYAKKEELPYYELMSSFVRKHADQQFTIKKIYEACGYEYISKKQKVTIERLKKMVDEHVGNGGEIYGRVETIPYYDYMCNLLAKYKRKGINYTIEDLMRLCGYEYLNYRRNNYKLMKLFEKIKDNKGYIDALKDSKEGKKVLYSIQERAKNKRMNVNEYLMIMFGVRFSTTYSDVDYISLVENDLLEFEKKYGYENVNHKFISENDTRLLYRIEHLARYFPCGSVTGNAVLTFYGYDNEVIDKKKNDESIILKRLYMLFPNREVYGLTKVGSLYRDIIKLSTHYDQTIEQYLNGKGFRMLASKKTYRLSKAKLDNDDELFDKICEIRNKLIVESNIMNCSSSTQSDISEEIEVIGNNVLKELEKGKKMSKR